MLNLKGFLTIQSIVDNRVGNGVYGGTSMVSPLGELSTLARTYSTKQRDYTSAGLTDYTLTSFFEDDNTGNAIELVATSTAIVILNAIKIYGTTTVGPIIDSAFYGQITTTYAAKVTNFTYGAWVSVGAIRMPEWVSWDSLEVQTVQGTPGHVKIWLSDTAFTTQYDQYEIRWAGLKDSNPSFIFQNNIGGVQSLAALNTADIVTNNLDAIKAGYPESKVTLYRFDYVPINPAIPPIPFWWAVANYSLYGDTLDTVKQDITTALLLNSTYTFNQWATYFPSLFKKSEFYILPRWDRIAIPNLAVQAGMHSSITNALDGLRYTKQHIPTYLPTDVDANLSVFNALYKTLSVLVVGDAGNLNGMTKIESLYPDYLPVPTTAPDFGRMSVKTQAWAMLLEQLIIAGEYATTTNSVTGSLRKVIRNGNLFVTGTANGYQFLVSAKSNGWT